MGFFDLFKKKKPQNEAKVNLNDDIYIDDEMKTFNPEQESIDLAIDPTSVVQPIVEEEVVEKPKLDEVDIRIDFEPKDYNDIQRAAWMLMHAKRVVVYLGNMDKTNRGKTLNFFGGMIYALNGQVEHYSKNIYIFTVSPKNL